MENNEEIKVSELCAIIGEDASNLETLTRDFIESFDRQNGWAHSPDGTRERFVELLEIIQQDGYLSREMANFMASFAKMLLDKLTFSISGNGGFAEGFDELPSTVQALLNAAMTFNRAAEEMKIDLCSANGGPTEFTPHIVYMVPVNPEKPVEITVENVNSEHFDIHLCSIEAFDEEDGMRTIRECLDEAFEEFGKPVLIALTCDTFMREFDTAEEALSESGQQAVVDMADHYLSDYDNVSTALASIVVGYKTPVVTATTRYIYDDAGQPEFVLGHANYSIDELATVVQDASHRGQICGLFASYLYMGDDSI